MNDIFIVGMPVDLVWLHMEFDFNDTLKYIGGVIIDNQLEANRLYDKYISKDSVKDKTA